MQVGGVTVSTATAKVPPPPVPQPMGAAFPMPPAGAKATLRVTALGTPAAASKGGASGKPVAAANAAPQSFATTTSPPFEAPAPLPAPNAAAAAAKSGGKAPAVAAPYVLGPLPEPQPPVIMKAYASYRGMGLDYSRPTAPYTLQSAFKTAGAGGPAFGAAAKCERGGSLC